MIISSAQRQGPTDAQFYHCKQRSLAKGGKHNHHNKGGNIADDFGMKFDDSEEAGSPASLMEWGIVEFYHLNLAVKRCLIVNDWMITAYNFQ